jgi:hypothetical protein
VIARLKLWAGAAIAGLSLILGVWIAGRREGRQAGRIDALRTDAKAQERMNEADLGIGASDAANVAWMRDFADKHKR